MTKKERTHEYREDFSYVSLAGGVIKGGGIKYEEEVEHVRTMIRAGTIPTEIEVLETFPHLTTIPIARWVRIHAKENPDNIPQYKGHWNELETSLLKTHYPTKMPIFELSNLILSKTGRKRSFKSIQCKAGRLDLKKWTWGESNGMYKAEQWLHISRVVLKRPLKADQAYILQCINCGDIAEVTSGNMGQPCPCWIHRNKKYEGVLYLILFENKKERFLKLGKAKNHGTPAIIARWTNKLWGGIGPYTATIIGYTDAWYAEIGIQERWMLKSDREYAKYKYQPKNLPSGYTECYTLDALDDLKQYYFVCDIAVKIEK